MPPRAAADVRRGPRVDVAVHYERAREPVEIRAAVRVVDRFPEREVPTARVQNFNLTQIQVRVPRKRHAQRRRAQRRLHRDERRRSHRDERHQRHRRACERRPPSISPPKPRRASAARSNARRVASLVSTFRARAPSFDVFARPRVARASSSKHADPIARRAALVRDPARRAAPSLWRRASSARSNTIRVPFTFYRTHRTQVYVYSS